MHMCVACICVCVCAYIRKQLWKLVLPLHLWDPEIEFILSDLAVNVFIRLAISLALAQRPVTDGDAQLLRIDALGMNVALITSMISGEHAHLSCTSASSLEN